MKEYQEINLGYFPTKFVPKYILNNECWSDKNKLILSSLNEYFKCPVVLPNLDDKCINKYDFIKKDSGYNLILVLKISNEYINNYDINFWMYIQELYATETLTYSTEAISNIEYKLQTSIVPTDFEKYIVQKFSAYMRLYTWYHYGFKEIDVNRALLKLLSNKNKKSEDFLTDLYKLMINDKNLPVTPHPDSRSKKRCKECRTVTNIVLVTKTSELCVNCYQNNNHWANHQIEPMQDIIKIYDNGIIYSMLLWTPIMKELSAVYMETKFSISSVISENKQIYNHFKYLPHKQPKKINIILEKIV